MYTVFSLPDSLQYRVCTDCQAHWGSVRAIVAQLLLHVTHTVAHSPQIVDRNSDGCVDINDFVLDGVISGTHYEKWREMRDKFDFDGDGQITMDEVSCCTQTLHCCPPVIM